MTELFTSKWANQDLTHLDVVPVGISRGVPRWPLPYRYKLLRLLAPSRETFALQDLEEFQQAYMAGLEDIGVGKIAWALRKISREHSGRPLALLCYENTHTGEVCHRRMFAEWWKAQTGQEVPELDDGVEAKRQPLIQETLFEKKEAKNGD
jgi:hypothetical protein